jgi:hypothetical protein
MRVRPGRVSMIEEVVECMCGHELEQRMELIRF